jgi:hypothetical protein
VPIRTAILLTVLITITNGTFEIDFSPDSRNVSVQIEIEGKGSTPYLQIEQLPIDGSDSHLSARRPRLPKGRYEIVARIMRQDTEEGRPYTYESSPTITIGEK